MKRSRYNRNRRQIRCSISQGQLGSSRQRRKRPQIHTRNNQDRRRLLARNNWLRILRNNIRIIDINIITKSSELMTKGILPPTRGWLFKRRKGCHHNLVLCRYNINQMLKSSMLHLTKISNSDGCIVWDSSEISNG